MKMEELEGKGKPYPPEFLTINKTTIIELDKTILVYNDKYYKLKIEDGVLKVEGVEWVDSPLTTV